MHKDGAGTCVSISDSQCWDDGANDVVVGKQERDEDGNCFTPVAPEEKDGETTTTATAATTEDATTTATAATTTTTAGEDSSS